MLANNLFCLMSSANKFFKIFPTPLSKRIMVRPLQPRSTFIYYYAKTYYVNPFQFNVYILLSLRESGDESMHIDSASYHSDRKYIVFENCLEELMSVCLKCGDQCTVTTQSLVGSMVTMKATCHCGFCRLWNSQPLHGKMPLGNLILTAGVLFSGSSPSKIVQFFSHVGVQFLSLRTYNSIQSAYVVPSVKEVWKTHQEQIFASYMYQGKQLTLGGDGRCDSPGYCAKYGSYSCMDLESNKILDLQLVQVIEVGLLIE